MLKFLLIGDRHNSETTPSSRIDDYALTCEKKDMEIMQIAKDNNVKAILHPGDFFTDSDKKLGNKFIAEIAQRWLSCGIPLIGISGNHDLIGNNIDSLPSTTAGLLDSLGVFKLIKNGETLSFTDNISTVHITGTNYHKNMDKPEFINDYIVNEKTSDVHIHIVHGMLTEKSYGKLFRHTTIDQIANTNADITFCGHDHVGFGIVNYKNKWFVNPGAVVRMTGAENELTRTVKVVLITIDNGTITLKEIPLSSVRPGHEVIDRSHLDEIKVREEYEDYIKDGVRKLKLGDSLSITEVLEKIYNRDEIPENIRKSITDSITSKTIDLNSNKKIAPVGTKIVHVKIHNFQSHENSEYDLSERFNVIVGESKQGKSASLRAIRWVVENKPAGKGLIRSGETEAFVELTLQNGTIIKRFISVKENGYKVFYPDGTVSEGNTRMMPIIQDLIGWCNMRVGENEELPLNHLKQGDSWYLNGDKYSSADRARILGAINKTEGADATIKDLEKENGRINEAIKHETVEIAVLANEIEEANKEREVIVKCREMIRLKMLVQKIKKYQELKRQYDEACKAVENINNQFNERMIVEHINAIRDKIKECERVNSYYSKILLEYDNINKLNPIIEVYGKFITDSVQKQALLAEAFNRYNRLVVIIKQHDESNRMIAYADKQIALYDKVISLPINTLREKITQRDLVADQCQKMSAWIGCLDRAEIFLQLSKDIDKFPTIKEKLNTALENYRRVQNIIDNYKKNRIIYNNDVQAYDAANREYQEALNKKIALLNESHVCPTCYSAIDEDTVKKIIEN